MKKTAIAWILTIFLLFLSFVACKENTETEPEALKTTAETTIETTIETTVESTMETTAETVLDLELNLDLLMLDAAMQPIFHGNTVTNETVMFLDSGEIKSLLYPIESLLSLTSYDGTVVYQEGKDYSVTEDGKLQILEASAIPCITSSAYYGVDGATLMTDDDGDGNFVNTYWGEGRKMTDYQVCVNYTHADAWEGFQVSDQSSVYRDLLEKLKNGEDVTVIFYGDSITVGANASWYKDYAPYQKTYPLLFTHALADLFGYTVKHIDVKSDPTLFANATKLGKVPEDYVAGERGVITYINTSVGEWGSSDGVKNAQSYLYDQITAYGCDLVVLGFGMNDRFDWRNDSPKNTQANIKMIADGIFAKTNQASVVILSTMMPNPTAQAVWNKNQPCQEELLSDLAEEYRNEGRSCAVSPMTSVSLSILQKKDFRDCSGNNINHPNDFFVRIYAQTLIETLIGYQNIGQTNQN